MQSAVAVLAGRHSFNCSSWTPVYRYYALFGMYAVPIHLRPGAMLFGFLARCSFAWLSVRHLLS